MSQYKNHNILALKGDKDTSDMDVCNELGLSPYLAGITVFNEAAIRKMH